MQFNQNINAMETLQTSLTRDRRTRTEAVRKPIVHTLTGAATELLPPGSGVVIVADSKSALFDELEKALASNNTEQINQLVMKNKRAVSALKKLSNQEALSALTNAPVLVDLNYDTKTIAVNLFTVKGVELTRAFFPFSGGDFESELFKFTEIAKESGVSSTKVMVVLHQPTLSRLELQALKIPKEMGGMNFGRVGGEMMCTPGALVATVTAGLIVAAVATAVGNCAPTFGEIGQEVINPQIAVGKMLAVKDLVIARQNAIMKTKRIR